MGGSPSTSGVKSRDTHVTVQCVRLSSASFQSFITSKFVEIPDNTIVYKLTNVHVIDQLTSFNFNFKMVLFHRDTSSNNPFDKLLEDH